MPKLFLAILAFIFTPLACLADPPRDSWENLMQLRPGHKIKVVDKQLKSWDGNLLSVTDESITIREKKQQQEITIKRAEVLRVTDLHRSKRARNALIGLAVGTAVGLPVSAGDKWDLSSTGGLILTGIFGGTGAGVGALIPHPRPTVYRAQQPVGKDAT